MNKFFEWIKTINPFFTLNIPLGRFGIVIGAGWYRGEAFKFFSVSLLEILEGVDRTINYVSVLDLHAFKFIIHLGVSL
jgi:hypothetical protein